MKTLQRLIARSQMDSATTRKHGKGFVTAGGKLEIKTAEKSGWQIVENARGEHGTGTVIFKVI